MYWSYVGVGLTFRSAGAAADSARHTDNVNNVSKERNMGTIRRVIAATSAIGALSVLGATPAFAHNAAHFYVNGTCIQVGSDKPAPYVGQGAPQTAGGRLDLVSDPVNGVDNSDQYGARLAANYSPVLLPGDCPA